MPVTRHPPCRPGRAVCPHPLPRLSSRPRCTAEPSGTHAATFDLRETGPCSLDAVEHPGTRLPGVTALRASPPLEPRARPVSDPAKQAGERASVPSHAVRVGVAPSVRLQPLEAWPLRQVPVVLAPGGPPWAGGAELRTRGTPPDAGHAGPRCLPSAHDAQQGDAPLHAGGQAPQPSQGGVLWGHLEGAWLQPLGEHPGAPLRVVLRAAGAAPVVGIAAPPCLAPTVRLDDGVTPEVPGRGQRHLCQDG